MNLMCSAAQQTASATAFEIHMVSDFKIFILRINGRIFLGKAILSD